MSNAQRHLLLTVREVSSLLRIHRPKVYDLIKAGTIAGFKLGADWRIKRDSLEQMIGPIPDEFFAKKGRLEDDDEELAEELPEVRKTKLKVA